MNMVIKKTAKFASIVDELHSPLTWFYNIRPWVRSMKSSLQVNKSTPNRIKYKLILCQNYFVIYD